MPALSARGGARSVSIAREGRHSEVSPGSAKGQEYENQLMRDREHVEETKREGRQGGAEGSPPRRDETADSLMTLTLYQQRQHLGRNLRRHRLEGLQEVQRKWELERSIPSSYRHPVTALL